MPDDKTVGVRLSELRERSGLTLSEVADLANYRGRSSVQKFFAADYNPTFLDRTVAGRLARAFAGRGNPPISDSDLFELAGAGESDGSSYSFKVAEPIKRDVPVYLSALVKVSSILKGQEPIATYLIEQDNPIDYIWHPPALMNVSGLYALRVQRVPLLPRYRPGELVLIDPTTPPRLGDDVCINWEEIEGQQASDLGVTSHSLAFFGTIERHTATAVHLRALDGETPFFISHDQYTSLHRLVSLTDALTS